MKHINTLDFFGLASTLYRLPMTREQEEIISACLYAHVNKFGEHVIISIRNIPYVPATLDEILEHKVYEGAFFGNLFRNDLIAYTCTGDDEEYALEHSPSRSLRVCTSNMTCFFFKVLENVLMPAVLTLLIMDIPNARDLMEEIMFL